MGPRPNRSGSSPTRGPNRAPLFPLPLFAPPLFPPLLFPLPTFFAPYFSRSLLFSLPKSNTKTNAKRARNLRNHRQINGRRKTKPPQSQRRKRKGDNETTDKPTGEAKRAGAKIGGPSRVPIGGKSPGRIGRRGRRQDFGSEGPWFEPDRGRFPEVATRSRNSQKKTRALNRNTRKYRAATPPPGGATPVRKQMESFFQAVGSNSIPLYRKSTINQNGGDYNSTHQRRSRGFARPPLIRGSLVLAPQASSRWPVPMEVHPRWGKLQLPGVRCD